MSGFRGSWKSARTCPFCGHHGWCAYQISEIGEQVWVCMYPADKSFATLGIGEVIVGTDGNEYVLAGYSNGKNGRNPLLESKNTYMYRRPKSKLAAGQCFVASSVKVVERVEKKEVLPYPNDQLDVMIRYFLTRCGLFLSQKDRDYLHGEGMTDEMIKKNLIVSYPESDKLRHDKPELCDTLLPYRVAIGKSMAERFQDLSRFPNAYINKNGKWTFGGPGGILFPLFDVHGRIIGLRNRPTYRFFDEKWNIVSKEQFEEHEKECDEKKVENKWYCSGKYLNFASSNYGPSMGTRIGVYTPTSSFTPNIIYVTEGEKKAIIAAEYLKAIVISVPGVSSWAKLFEEDDTGISPVEFFYQGGTSIFAIAYDADKETNQNVMRQQDSLVNELKDYGFDLCMCDWNIVNGKGLDDLLVNGFRPNRYFMS